MYFLETARKPKCEEKQGKMKNQDDIYTLSFPLAPYYNTAVRTYQHLNFAMVMILTTTTTTTAPPPDHQTPTKPIIAREHANNTHKFQVRLIIKPHQGTNPHGFWK